jgi:hypothetical protein
MDEYDNFTVASAEACADAIRTALQAYNLDAHIEAYLITYTHQTCTKCKENKPHTDFGKRGAGMSKQCKSCVNEAQQQRFAASPFAVASKRDATQKWARANPDKIKVKQQNYQGIATARTAERRRTETDFKIAGNTRNRIGKLLRGGYKSAPTLKLLGCSIEYLREWLASQLPPNLTWSNYGTHWEIDHVQPCCGFDLTQADKQKACFEWQNTRPMTCTTNRSKNGFRPSDAEIDAHKHRAAEWLAQHPETYN